MMWLAGCCTVLLVALAVCQLLIVAAYLRLFFTFPRPDEASAERRAAVVLSVRGPDPFLDATLRGLIQQDYPDYTIFVIVDSQDDPAWQQIRTVQGVASGERIVAQTACEPMMTCSLKCGALAQVVCSLDSSYDVVAFIDGDALPHVTWLRELTAPLKDPSIGATTGNRWYAPQHGQWGSLVRYFWNTGAVVQLWLNGIAWGGSMAMRASVIREVDLASAWQTSFFDDGAVCRQMKRHGYRVQFVPWVMMLNREEIGLGAFVRWTERQLLGARLAEAGWFAIWFHALNLLGNQVVLLIAMTWGLFAGARTIAALSIGGLLAYWISSLSCVVLLEMVVSQGRQKPFQWMSFQNLLRAFPAFLLTHAVYPLAMVRALRLTRVSWRGAEYEIRGRRGIRLLEYGPYRVTGDGPPSQSVM